MIRTKAAQCRKEKKNDSKFYSSKTSQKKRPSSISALRAAGPEFTSCSLKALGCVAGKAALLWRATANPRAGSDVMHFDNPEPAICGWGDGGCKVCLLSRPPPSRTNTFSPLVPSELESPATQQRILSSKLAIPRL